jgi:hypothetical protein
LESGELDIVSTGQNAIRVHECACKVDGITKHVVNHDFKSDLVFGSHNSTLDVF